MTFVAVLDICGIISSFFYYYLYGYNQSIPVQKMGGA